MFGVARRSVKVIPPERRIRVLVVDDSVVIRRLVSHALAEDPELEVVGVAANGSIALQRIPQLEPDILTLDIEMPEMDGLETLRHVRQLYPNLPVIMFSTLTERGASATLDALSLGANDYVTKAANVGSLEKSMAALRSELIPKLKQFFVVGSAAEPVRPAPAAPVVAVRTAPIRPSNIARGERKIVAIGVSTGGPDALAAVLPAFPKDFPIPIVIVQHMPPLFTRFLADRLNAISAVHVEESADGVPLKPGRALLAAGGSHLRVRKGDGNVTATMDQEPPENSCRPSVDALFRSVSEVYGSGAIAVILTGMGQDGLKGARLLKEAGSYIIAQDESSSVVWGMPGSVVKSGLANATVALPNIVPEILKQI